MSILAYILAALTLTADEFQFARGQEHEKNATDNATASSTSNLLQDGMQLFNQGKYLEAIDIFNKVLTNEPDNIIALNSKGLALHDLGEYNEAISYYDKALAIDPNNTMALYNKGITLWYMGSYDDSIVYFDKVLAINQSDTNALTHKALALLDSGKDREAIVYFDKALALNQSDIVALNSKGLALHDLGEYNEAISYFDKALAIDPNNTLVSIHKQDALDSLNPGTVPVDAQPDEFKTYENSDLGIKVLYPSDWIKIPARTPSEPNITFTQIPENDSDIPFFDFRIFKSNLPEYSLADYNDNVNSVLNATLDEFRLEKSGYTFLSGIPAFAWDYTFSDNGTKMHRSDYVTLKDSVFYTISFDTTLSQYPTYQPIIQKMVDSFEIIK